MMKNIYKLIFLIIGIATLAYMIFSIGPVNIWNNLLQTGWWFVPILLSWLVIYVMNAFAFKSIIEEPNVPETKLPFIKILQLTVSGYSINYVTPFVALGGEPYRIMELKPHLGEAKASSSVLLYGMVHILSHIVFWLVSIFLILAVVPLSASMLIVCLFILFFGLGIFWSFSKIYKRGFTVTIVRFFQKIPFVDKYARTFYEDKKTVLEHVDQQIQDLYTQRRPQFFVALFWEFFARVVGCAELYFIGVALGLDMSVIQAFIVSSGSSLFANLIFFLPMQLGTREGGLAMAVTSIGFPASVGIFMGLATRIREIIWIGIGLIWMSIVRKDYKLR